VIPPSGRGGAPLLRVVHGDNFHRSANLVHPYLAIADHNALVAGEQIVSPGSSDGSPDLGREDPRLVGAQGGDIAVGHSPPS
jgi:hypothetical protein